MRTIKRLFTSSLLALLVGPSAVLFLWAANLTQVTPAMTVRAVLVSTAVGLALMVSLVLITRSLARGSFLSGWLLFASFTYGHFASIFTDGSSSGLVTSASHSFLLLYGAVVLLVSGVIIQARRFSPSLFAILNTFILGILVLNLALIAVYEVRYRSKVFAFTPPVKAAANADADMPDVYYIILDGYARQDELLKTYQFDNSPFINELRQMGFYIADCAFSNYPRTTPSLASSLNMSYLDTLGIDENSMMDSHAATLTNMVSQSAVRYRFAELGYKTVAFQGYLPAVDLRDADYYFNYQEHMQGASLVDLYRFELLVMGTTILQPFLAPLELSPESLDLLPRWLSVDLNSIHNIYQISDRQWFYQSRYTFDVLPTVTMLPVKKFTYVHFYSTHTPFVFNAEGRYQPFKYHYDDAGYIPALQYTNKRILEIIRTLIETSQQKPIIVLQGDHGYTQGLEHNMILNAYYFPDGDYSNLYPTITPVNSFRVILSQYFGDNYQLLPDDVMYLEPIEKNLVRIHYKYATCDLK